MRNTGWLRYGLATATLAAAGLAAFLVACGDDDSNVAPGTPDGGGGADSQAVEGGGGGDSGSDSAAPKPEVARLQLINAATDLGPSDPSGGLRLCFGAGTSATDIALTPLPALPEESPVASVPPAVYIGTGGNIPGAGLPLDTAYLQPYLMNAESLAKVGDVKPGPSKPSASCDELLSNTFDAGGHPLVENVDYWKLPVIPAGTLLSNKSYIIILTGCSNDTTIANKEACGTGFTPSNDGGAGVGNLEAHIYEVDRATAIPSDKVGTQFIHASPAANVVLKAGLVGVNPGYTSTPGDATGFKGVGDGGAVNLYDKTALVQVSGVNFASDSFTANPLAANLAIPLPLIQQISYPTGVPDGGAYANGASFTFIAVGDPTASPDAGNGQFNTKTFHYLALPNNPALETYKP